MIGDTVISDNEREIGIVQVFTPEDGVQGWASDAANDIKNSTNYPLRGLLGMLHA